MASKASTMTTILCLPPELVTSIGDYLTEDDLLAFRMTCKEFNAKGHKLHTRAIFHTRSLYYVPAGLENLLKIARHPSGANKLVKKLVISLNTPYLDLPSPFDDDPPREQPLAGLISRMIRDSEASTQEVPHQRTWEEDAALLTLALSNLPNIHTLEFEHYNIPETRAELNLFYPSLKLRPGTRVPKVLTDTLRNPHFRAVNEVDKVWSHVLQASLWNNLNIETIKSQRDGRSIQTDWFHHSPRQLSKYKETFSNLKTLQLYVYPKAGYFYSDDGYDDDYDSRRIDGPNAAFHWISAVGKRIVDLKFSFAVYPRYSFFKRGKRVETYMMPKDFTLPNLRWLEFTNMMFKADELKAFLQTHSHTLHGIGLRNCLIEDPKQNWFEILHICYREIPDLQLFDFEPNDLSVTFRLPCLQITGYWTKPGTWCEVYSLSNHGDSRRSPSRQEIADKNIQEELEKNPENAENFWSSISDGDWCGDDSFKPISPRNHPVAGYYSEEAMMDSDTESDGSLWEVEPEGAEDTNPEGSPRIPRLGPHHNNPFGYRPPRGGTYDYTYFDEGPTTYDEYQAHAIGDRMDDLMDLEADAGMSRATRRRDIRRKRRMAYGLETSSTLSVTDDDTGFILREPLGGPLMQPGPAGFLLDQSSPGVILDDAGPAVRSREVREHIWR